MEIRLAALARRVYGTAEPVVVQVAETTNGRRRLARNLLIALAVLEAMLIALSGAVIWIAVGRGLAPLAALRRDIEGRAAPGTIMMDPLPATGVAQELVPLVEAFNVLLKRLRQSFSAIQRFTGDASHQLRTPLTILMTHLDRVRRLVPRATTAAPRSPMPRRARADLSGSSRSSWCWRAPTRGRQQRPSAAISPRSLPQWRASGRRRRSRRD
jgi:signal transduction histidine kinase